MVKIVTFRMSDEEYRRLKRYADRRGLAVGNLIKKALRYYMWKGDRIKVVYISLED